MLMIHRYHALSIGFSSADKAKSVQYIDKVHCGREFNEANFGIGIDKVEGDLLYASDVALSAVMSESDITACRTSAIAKDAKLIYETCPIDNPSRNRNFRKLSREPSLKLKFPADEGKPGGWVEPSAAALPALCPKVDSLDPTLSVPAPAPAPSSENPFPGLTSGAAPPCSAAFVPPALAPAQDVGAQLKAAKEKAEKEAKEKAARPAPGGIKGFLTSLAMRTLTDFFRALAIFMLMVFGGFHTLRAIWGAHQSNADNYRQGLVDFKMQVFLSAALYMLAMGIAPTDDNRPGWLLRIITDTQEEIELKVPKEPTQPAKSK